MPEVILLDSNDAPDMNMHHVDLIYRKALRVIAEAWLIHMQLPVDPATMNTDYLTGFQDGLYHAMKLVEQVQIDETYQSADGGRS